MRSQRRKPKKLTKEDKAQIRRSNRLLRVKRLKQYFLKLQNFYDEKFVQTGISQSSFWKELVQKIDLPKGNEKYSAFNIAMNLGSTMKIPVDEITKIARAVKRGRIK